MIWYRWCCREIVALTRDSSTFPDPGPCLQPILAVDAEKSMKRASIWYSAGSSWPDLPNGRKIRCWLDQYPGKLAVHPGVGVAQLTISKFLQNPPSSCAARHPPAFEQLEQCWPWNIVGPPIDHILFGQLRLSAVERAHNNGCWPWETW
jgi:hypothetical protein